MRYDREPQAEHWWQRRSCPAKGTHYQTQVQGIIGCNCDASHCALWRETARDQDGNKCGICTL